MGIFVHTIAVCASCEQSAQLARPAHSPDRVMHVLPLHAVGEEGGKREQVKTLAVYSVHIQGPAVAPTPMAIAAHNTRSETSMALESV